MVDKLKQFTRQIFSAFIKLPVKGVRPTMHVKEAMGMPSLFTYGADVILRSTPLSAAEWLELVNVRRYMLSTQLFSYTLPELGDCHMLRGGPGGWHIINQDQPEVDAPGNLGLKTQGLWVYGPSSTDADNRYGHRLVWGLARKPDSWMIAKIDFRLQPERENHYEVATLVTLKPVEAQEVIEAVEPHEVLSELHSQFARLVDRRRHMVKQSNDLLEAFAAQDEALRLISRSTSQG